VLVPFASLALLATAWLAAGAEVELSPVLAQLSLCCIEVLVLGAVAILFSSFSSPFLTGIFTLGIWVLGRSADDMATMKSKQLGAFLLKLLRVAAEVLPNLQLYVPGRTLLTGQSKVLVWPYVATSVLDRVLLRAGETVHMKHLYRQKTRGGFRLVNLNALPGEAIVEHQGSEERYRVPLKWDAQSTAQSTWQVPKDAKTGVYSVIFEDALPGRKARRIAATFRVEGPSNLDVRYGALDPTRGALFATVSWLRPHARGGSSQVLLDLSCVSTR
jgi:hypothetical protein